jgi:hypothetical protein
MKLSISIFALLIVPFAAACASPALPEPSVPAEPPGVYVEYAHEERPKPAPIRYAGGFPRNTLFSCGDNGAGGVSCEQADVPEYVRR